MSDTVKTVGEIFMWFVIVIIVFMLLFSLLYTIATPFFYIECKTSADVMGVDYEYRFLTGCFYKDYSGMFVPSENWGRRDIQVLPTPVR